MTFNQSNVHLLNGQPVTVLGLVIGETCEAKLNDKGGFGFSVKFWDEATIEAGVTLQKAVRADR